MAAPDLTGLTEAELQATANDAAARLQALQNVEQNNRDILLAPEKVRGQIATLEAQVVSLKAMTRSSIGADTAQAVLDLSRATRRNTSNIIRLLRIVGNELESANTGEEA